MAGDWPRNGRPWTAPRARGDGSWNDANGPETVVMLTTTGSLSRGRIRHKKKASWYAAVCGGYMAHWSSVHCENFCVHCENFWKNVNCERCLAKRPAPRKSRPVSRDREAVAVAWREGRKLAGSHFATDGASVWSYVHEIGYTTPDGRKVARDCRVSGTTSTHAGALRGVADRVECCPCAVRIHAVKLVSTTGFVREHLDRYERNALVNADAPRAGPTDLTKLFRQPQD